jgi:hypothetical protein
MTDFITVIYKDTSRTYKVITKARKSTKAELTDNKNKDQAYSLNKQLMSERLGGIFESNLSCIPPNHIILYYMYTA